MQRFQKYIALIVVRKRSGKLNADSSDYAQVYIPNGRSVDIDLDYCAREEMLVDWDIRRKQWACKYCKAPNGIVEVQK